MVVSKKGTRIFRKEEQGKEAVGLHGNVPLQQTPIPSFLFLHRSGRFALCAQALRPLSAQKAPLRLCVKNGSRPLTLWVE